MPSRDSEHSDASHLTLIPRLPTGSRLHRFEQRLDEWWLDQLLATLVSALSMHDGGSGDHSMRVASLVIDLAKEVGYASDSSELVEVRQGALLHDIGKLGVETAILQKPGPLTDEEWVVIETHPGLGYVMLKDISPLANTAEMVYASHERWDGGGYPRGLESEQIPAGARLFILADAWDAMTSDRPYRSAMPFEAAIQEVHDHTGTQFDPSAVAALDRLIAERGGQWGASELRAAA